MAERINKDAFIANILECFTLLQTYEECYKEILDIIDVINGLNESDLTVENLQKLVEGSEYISLDINEAGTKLVISLDRTHVDETVKEDSTNLVTSGAVFDAVANANGNVLRLPINVPTEPLVVMIGTNNAQTNIPLGDGLAVVNNHLVATGGGGGGGISPSEANTFTAKQTFSGGIVSTKPATADDELTTLAQMKNSNLGNQEYTNTKFNTLNDQLVATNAEVANKLDKATTTSGSYAYCRNGNKDETIPVNSLVGKDTIVRRTNTGTIKANAGVDDNDCVNKKQLNATDSQVQTLNEEVETIKTDTIPGLFSQENKWSVAQAYISMHDLVSVFNTAIEMQKTPATYKFGQLTIADDGTNETYINRYDLPIMKSQASKHIILTDKISAKVVQITQTAYDALTTKDANTLYVIVG